MIKTYISRFVVTVIIFSAAQSVAAEKITILHTNDTHSIIDPYHANDLGGVVRRKAAIDSIRLANENVLLVDAGDVVQGSLYFSLFGGEVEQQVMNALNYDIQILGNHEFDNGMDALENYLKGIKAELLATNYDLSKTNISSYFKPYTTRTFDNIKLGFFAINVEPEGLIDLQKSQGVKHINALKAANAMAWYLKNIEHCDYVIAVTHIGYDGSSESDSYIASHSENIDLIIGGHSHTTIDPSASNAKQSRFVNLAGDTVVVAQTGKYGANLGEIIIDTDTHKITSSLIKIDNRHETKTDENLKAIISRYKNPVDSIMNHKVGKAKEEFPRTPELANWMADFVRKDASRLTDKKIDLAIVNQGGVRSSFPKGNISKGAIMQAFPFDNYEVVLAIKGSDLKATLDSMAAHGGNAISANVSATIDHEARKCGSILIDGKTIDEDRTYYLATINYLAQGNDGMTPLRNGKEIARSENLLYNDMINAFEKGFLKNKPQSPDHNTRMK